MSKQITAFCAFVLVALVSGCKLDDTSPNVKPVLPYESLSDFFQQDAQPLQSFNGIAEQSIVLTADNGSNISFPANAFIDKSGNEVSGQIEIQLIESLKKSDFLMNKIGMDVNGVLVDGAGMYFVSANQNGDELDLQKGMSIVFPENGQLGSATDLEIFYGGTSANNVEWSTATDTSALSLETIAGGDAYFMDITRMEWLTGGRLLDNLNYNASISATLTNLNNFKELKLFVVLDDYNTISELTPVGDRFESIPLPANATATLVALGMDDFDLLFESQPITITDGFEINLVMTSHTEEELITAIREID